MNDSWDLRRLLQGWAYDPEQDARLLRGDDGREILQVRTPLGLEQYELDGRPDAARPQGMESLLDFQLKRLEEAKTAGREADFTLGEAECAELFNEGTLYYFRYVRLFQLRDWSRTLRDTARNLRLFDFVHRFADREDDRQFLEKWRPYILRVNASAAAMQQVDGRDYERALILLSEAMEKIQTLEEIDDETFKFEQERSLNALQELSAQIQKNRPLTEIEQLERQLRRAIERQEFERAAELRDRIRELKKHGIC
jgi:hypothetical protein